MKVFQRIKLQLVALLGAALWTYSAVLKNNYMDKDYNDLIENGRKQMTSGQEPEAEQTFRAANRHDPKAAWPHINLGHVYLGQHRWEDARREFEVAMNLDPADGYSFYGLARAYHGLGKGAEYASALEREGTSPSTEIPRHLVLALSAFDQGDMVQALHHYQKAQEWFPEGYFLFDRIGEILIRLHRYAEARELLEQRTNKPEVFPYSYLLLGYAEKGLGHSGAALKAFKMALDLKPDLQSALLQLTRLEWRLGHWRSAWRHFWQYHNLTLADAQLKQQ